MDYNKANNLVLEFFEGGKQKDFERKTTILKYGDIPSYVYYIHSGSVKVSSYTETGNERIHYLYKKREIFPLTSIFGRKMYDITFAAFTKATIFIKPLDEFRDFLNKEPYALLGIINQQMIVYDRIFNLNLVTAEQRVIGQINHLCERFGVVENDRVIIDISLTIQEFANKIRLSREKTGKILRTIENSGAIVLSRQRFVVYPEKLKLYEKNITQ